MLLPTTYLVCTCVESEDAVIDYSVGNSHDLHTDMDCGHRVRTCIPTWTQVTDEVKALGYHYHCTVY